MDLTKQFGDDQYVRALDSWSWLDLHGEIPRFASLFGDVFLEDEVGAWWFLDTTIPLEPMCVRAWLT